jgi:hypothetical protein
LTPNEFQLLVAPFETAFQAHMAAWRLDGKLRTARQFTVYKNCVRHEAHDWNGWKIPRALPESP